MSNLEGFGSVPMYILKLFVKRTEKVRLGNASVENLKCSMLWWEQRLCFLGKSLD